MATPATSRTRKTSEVEAFVCGAPNRAIRGRSCRGGGSRKCLRADDQIAIGDIRCQAANLTLEAPGHQARQGGPREPVGVPPKADRRDAG
eukprot:6214528-Pyramimonas_sp.AAC.1